MADNHRITRILLARIFSKIHRSTDRFYNGSPCWEWTASIFPKTGYGQYRIPGIRGCLAHRVLYELFVEPVPPHLVCDHLCKNTICVNPAHLEPVRQRINLIRGESFSGVNMRKTHCIHGHPFNGSNLLLYRRKSNNSLRRICRQCVHNRNSDLPPETPVQPLRKRGRPRKLA